MPVTQILSSTGRGDGGPTYTITLDGNNVNEGTLFGVVFGGTNIPDGTYYWTVTNSGDFGTASGSIVVNGNIGSFEITPTADATTEGAETFTVSWRRDSVTGTILATSDPVTINDTSTTPQVPPFSLDFPAGNPYLLVSNTQTDWNLGTTYTIEYWSKEANPSYPNQIRTVMSQGPNSGKIDLGYASGHLLFNNSEPFTPEPSVGGVPTTLFNISSPGGWNGVGTPSSWTDLATTGGTGTGLRISVAGAQGGYANAVGITNPGSGYTSGDVITAVGESSVSFTIGNCSARGLWTHVAFVADGGNITLYYNGVNQTTFNAGPALSDGSTDLVIGRRGPTNDFQYFFGKLAMIRISNTAKYLANFSPSLSYGVEADTKLMLDSNTPLVDGTGTHPISVQGAVTTSMDFPSFQSLEFVENQGDYLDVAGSSDWNLGTTWTIEFWLKANAASQTAGGGIWGLLNQVGWSTTNNIVVALSDNKLVFLSVAESANADVRYTEPTPGVWTHVAIVNNAGTQKVFYNGIEQTKVSGTFGTANYTNSTDQLRIGRLGPQNGGTLNGKMAMVRISSTAKYLTAFTATTTYGVEGDTQLFLDKVNPTVDRKAHFILNNGVAVGSDFPTVPQTFVALAYGQNNGYATNYGGNQISVLVADYPIIGDVPNGATVTITGQGSGTFTVDGSYVQSGIRFFTVGTLNFTAWGSDTLTFTWQV